MKKLIYYTSILLFTAYGCSEPASVEETSSEEEASIPETPIAPPSTDSTINCTGEIMVAPDARISVHAVSNGIIREIHGRKGDLVKKGSVLARLEHPDIIKIQEEYLKARADKQYREAEYNRKKSLNAQGATAEKDLQSAAAEFEAAKANLDSYEKQLQLLGISKDGIVQNGIQSSIVVRSPMDAYITDILVNQGMYVSQDKAMFQLVDLKKKYVELNVFTADIGKVKSGQKVKLRIAGNSVDVAGTVDNVGKAVDMNLKSISVLVQVEDPNNELIVGSTVFAEISLK